MGIALSGGGFRATVFHLGVLARLAKENLLEDVSFLSTVSGGSLCVGLIMALSEFRWPSSSQYLQKVVQQERTVMTTEDLQVGMIKRVLTTFWRIFETRADDLSDLLKSHWGVTKKLGELPENPRWMINATCYETGKNWRFERFRMGDYIFGYTYDTDKVPLSDALAASAGFPGLIGPLVLNTEGYNWFEYKASGKELATPQNHMARKTAKTEPTFDQVHLWDGGVYDNHGLEGLHNFADGWREDVEFLLVSDAAGRSKPERYRSGPRALLRIITGIMMNQIRSLRSRAIVERLINHPDRGVFLQIGNTCEEVLTAAGRESEIDQISSKCLPPEEAERAATMDTVIRRLSDSEFELLFRHGFEVADCTLHGYYPDTFAHLPYVQ